MCEKPVRQAIDATLVDISHSWRHLAADIWTLPLSCYRTIVNMVGLGWNFLGMIRGTPRCVLHWSKHYSVNFFFYFFGGDFFWIFWKLFFTDFFFQFNFFGKGNAFLTDFLGGGRVDVVRFLGCFWCWEDLREVCRLFGGGVGDWHQLLPFLPGLSRVPSPSSLIYLDV